MKIHRVKTWVLIATLYIILSAAYAVLTPPWESPDEPAHYIYISELAVRWQPPPPSTIKLTGPFFTDQVYMASNSHWFHPMVGYLPAALVYKVIQLIAPSGLPRTIPQMDPEIGINPLKHPRLFVNTSPSIIEGWKNNWGLLIIRICLSWSGILIIYATWRVGRWLDPANEWLGVAAAGWVAFLPQFTFINATLRNDTLTNMLAAIVFLLAAAMQVSLTRRNQLSLLLGILLGLGMLTKYTFLYIVPLGVLAIVLTAPKATRAWIKPLVLLIAPMVVLNGTYYLAYPDARLALAYTITFLSVQPNVLTWELLPTFTIQLFADLFYARFGWANVGPRSLFARAAAGLWGLGVCVSIFRAIRYRQDPAMRQSIQILILLGAGVLFAIIGVVRFNLADYQPQGRYLFPAIIAWPLLGLWGLWQILPLKQRPVVALAVAVAMLIFNLYSLSTLITAYY